MSSTRVKNDWGPRFLMRAAAWALCLSLVLGGLALVAEPALLLSHGTPLVPALAAGLVALSLATLISLFLAPLLTVFSHITRQLDGRPYLRHLWPLPISAASLAIGWLVTDSTARSRPLLHTAVLLAFATPIVVITWILRRAHRWLMLLSSLVLGGTALFFDLATPRDLYPEIHDLFTLLAVTSGLVASDPLRRRLLDMQPRHVLYGGLGALLGSIAIIAVVDRTVPGWHSAAAAHGHFTSELSRSLRLVADFDGDGFSPIAWGGDCDDTDPDRNPMANDDPGGRDNNCNGVAPKKKPTDGDHGLAPPSGDPDLSPGAADLVLLVTIDCFRADALLPQVMPRLFELASHGLIFERTYAAATSTRVATRLLQRGSNDGVPVASRLGADGVSSTAVIGLRDELFGKAVSGFDRYEQPPTFRWSAEEVTGHALTDLRRNPTGRHYLWVHYYDSHTPYEEYERHLEDTAALRPPSKSQYLAELTRIDASFGMVIDHLRSRGRFGRTVLIVVGDHGEGFGEHQVMRHHVSGYEAVIRVPGILVAPGLVPGRYPELVSHRDIPATIAGAFGLVHRDPVVETFGRSWLRLRAAPRSPLHEFVVARSGRSASGNRTLSPIIVLVEGRYKLVKGVGDGFAELFDVVGHPEELRDLTFETPQIEKRLRRHAALYRDLDRWPEWPQTVEIVE